MITKILPGTNIELKSGARDADLSVTGVVAMALPLHWGGRVTVIHAGDNTLYPLGYKISDPALKLVREVMNGAKQLILYRLNRRCEGLRRGFHRRHRGSGFPRYTRERPFRGRFCQRRKMAC